MLNFSACFVRTDCPGPPLFTVQAPVLPHKATQGGWLRETTVVYCVYPAPHLLYVDCHGGLLEFTGKVVSSLVRYIHVYNIYSAMATHVRAATVGTLQLIKRCPSCAAWRPNIWLRTFTMMHAFVYPTRTSRKPDYQGSLVSFLLASFPGHFLRGRGHKLYCKTSGQNINN